MGAPDHVTPPELAKPGPKGEPRSYGPRVMAMSFYPKEGMPLWDKYSTHAIIHTLDVYSRFSFAYPYPVAISVNGPVGGGPGKAGRSPTATADGSFGTTGASRWAVAFEKSRLRTMTQRTYWSTTSPRWLRQST